MSNLSQWSNSAGGNTSASPDGFPENMNPSGVNDAAREVMAATRRWYEDAQWINLGDTPTRVDGDTLTISGDKRTDYHVGRRVRIYDNSTLYGSISNVTYSAPNTSMDLTFDSGSLVSTTQIALGILSNTNHSIPSSLYVGGTRVRTMVVLDTPETLAAGTSATTLTSLTSTTLTDAGAVTAKIKVVASVTTGSSLNDAGNYKIYAGEPSVLAESEPFLIADAYAKCVVAGQAVGNTGVGTSDINLSATNSLMYKVYLANAGSITNTWRIYLESYEVE